MNEIIVGTDWILLPVYLVVFMVIAVWYRSKLDDERDRKYFMQGLYLKLLGGISFSIIYVYFYQGGDTVTYWHGAKCIINLAREDFNSFINIMFGSREWHHLTAFNANTGFPEHLDDPNSFAVNVFSVPFVMLGAKKFLLSTLVLDFFLYFPIFRFYMFLRNIKKESYLIPAVAVLFIPSTVFWSAGILKDAYTFSFSLLAVVGIYNIFIVKKSIFKYLIYLAFSAYVIISLKPYIFYAILLAVLILIIVYQTSKIEGIALKILLIPIFIGIVAGSGIFAFTRIGNAAGGAYSSVDAMVEKAYVTQQDLSQEYYGENTFDIGEFDPSVGGLLSKFPVAVLAGLYRPYLWDGSSFFLLISAIENFVLMLLSLFVIIRIGPQRFISYLGKEPFLTFCISFSIILAFFVGVTTGVFGALVRYRIPLLPFFTYALLTMYNMKRESKSIEEET